METSFKKLLFIYLIFTILLTSCGNSNVSNNGVVQKTKQEDKVLSSGTQEIINLQLKKGPDVVSSLDCNKYDTKGKIFCEKEKEKVNEWKNEITWASVYKKGKEYIIAFDCNNIKQDIGKKYCMDYKKNLDKLKNGE